MDKIILLAKKLKALAERGIGGEKINAETMLESLMIKHNLSFEQIQENEIITKIYNVSEKYQRLFIQVIQTINPEIQTFGHRESRNKAIVECTPSEAIELQAKFDFYKKAYESESKEHERIFFEAFVQKNRLFEDKEPEPKELSEEEIIRFKKILSVSKDLKENIYYKGISQ